ncbi:uncharacterized protein MYCFIDRAFT_173226 [Pseudocercospora fijiensis CIRAD86]|uniref:Uncharacterized protein n=1 Tax=Pseudocercospora fijiensis (strain CIRAD86) TaxID=383855 RepID=M3AHX1_PSEFD|nr:uncharacterized protein MYCFIDRAFT_173226 [Pseudocercospora fijiensis CIRAD86]EME84191.1 hypothetical protein MYCFIDRAFT_173226 [Pseudocercospora fijiensis CIRAD86]
MSYFLYCSTLYRIRHNNWIHLLTNLCLVYVHISTSLPTLWVKTNNNLTSQSHHQPGLAQSSTAIALSGSPRSIQLRLGLPPTIQLHPSTSGLLVLAHVTTQYCTVLFQLDASDLPASELHMIPSKQAEQTRYANGSPALSFRGHQASRQEAAGR